MAENLDLKRDTHVVAKKADKMVGRLDILKVV
jgi:hypothetical protein